mmetsp:Transcript_17856/g.30007  ORF Transcript_17856/g.30007 Transcript_17856/m.30007 type:complete len:379 (-) Transcript_17856:201-1337(-)|eukprot:CAMPEP_0198220954 /NCGR_PEP_ID=MMETSP1445-20131203/81498_1 /TAXON_ID=36898 /ORGANISM="Pyramimonas sp., Strain CCMP2087" /LENGTH=378 /DNA_ID=CAMNT_0043898905 /DNA_START=165 /DNA_END=1301 /DNA_ORIENTATION=+
MSFTIPKKKSSSSSSFSIPKKGSSSSIPKNVAPVSAGARLKECFNVSKKRAEEATRGGEEAVKAAVKELTQLSLMKVTAEQLVESQVVKDLKHLRSHPKKQIADLACRILTGWRAVVEKGDGAHSAAHLVPPPQPTFGPAPPPVDPKKVPKGGPSSKKNSVKPDPNATAPSATKPKSDLPLGAESARDLKWQNGRWVNLKHPELVEAPAVSGQDDESYYSSDNDDRQQHKQRRSRSRSPERRAPNKASASSERPDSRQKREEASAWQRSDAKHKKEERHRSIQRDRPKKRSRRPDLPPGWETDSDEDLDASAQLRKLTGYDPSRYKDQDDDADDMVASFDEIQREEKRSAALGRQFDKAEEERERTRKEQKLKKKMGK